MTEKTQWFVMFQKTDLPESPIRLENTGSIRSEYLTDDRQNRRVMYSLHLKLHKVINEGWGQTKSIRVNTTNLVW